MNEEFKQAEIVDTNFMTNAHILQTQVSSEDFNEEENKRDFWAKEKDFRLYLERTLIEKKIYKVFDLFYAILAGVSSLIKVILGYFVMKDLYETIYKWYETIDYIICFYFLFVYLVKMYVAQHRI